MRNLLVRFFRISACLYDQMYEHGWGKKSTNVRIVGGVLWFLPTLMGKRREFMYVCTVIFAFCKINSHNIFLCLDISTKSQFSAYKEIWISLNDSYKTFTFLLNIQLVGIGSVGNTFLLKLFTYVCLENPEIQIILDYISFLAGSLQQTAILFLLISYQLVV